MGDQVVVPGDETVRTTWRRKPLERSDQFIIDIKRVTTEENWQDIYFIYHKLSKKDDLYRLYWEIPRGVLTFPTFLYLYRQESGSSIFAMMHKGEFCGVFTLTNVYENHRCDGGFWIEPRLRGVNSVMIAEQALTFAHATLKINYVYLKTPWRAARELASRSGLRLAGEFASYHLHRDPHGRAVEKPAWVFYSESGAWRYRVASRLIDMGYGELSAGRLVAKLWGEEAD